MQVIKISGPVGLSLRSRNELHPQKLFLGSIQFNCRPTLGLAKRSAYCKSAFVNHASPSVKTAKSGSRRTLRSNSSSHGVVQPQVALELNFKLPVMRYKTTLSSYLLLSYSCLPLRNWRLSSTPLLFSTKSASSLLLS
jgi:hypothetical protein